LKGAEQVEGLSVVQAIVPATGTPLSWWIAPLSSLVALVFAYIFYKQMMSSPKGNETMESIASYVREGAYAYLFRQYKIVALIFVLLSIIFMVLAYYGIQNPFVPVAFLTGVIHPFLARGYDVPFPSQKNHTRFLTLSR
jgi:K(+)-stimulated pyrophosphate-energized sodium pump